MRDINRVLLIYPPTGFYMRDDRCQAPVEGMTAQPPRAPMDLAYMAAVLEKEAITCKIRDYPAEGLGWDQFEKDLKEFKPDMLIFSITTPTLQDDLHACIKAKSINPQILTVSKGAHYSEQDTEILKKCVQLDIIIRGESEFAVRDIAKATDLSKVLGITFRKDSDIVRTPERPLLDDLDMLPFPARHLLDNSLYVTPDTKRPIAYIYTGRGCPYHCIYCAVDVVSGYKLKSRSPKSVVDEIEECIEKFGIRDFFFRADTFTMRKEWAIDICRMIIERGLKIRWGTNSRVDTICKERLEWMKKAGCWIIGFGVESGNQAMLDKMKKNARIEDAINAVRLCKETGIKTYLLFMIGLPWDSKETVDDSIRFAKRLDGDFIDFNIAYPLPGTEFYKIAKENKLFIEDDLHRHDYSKPIVRTFHLSTEELINLRKKALRSFYLRPAYIIKTLSGIRSFKEAISYCSSGMRFLKKVPETRHFED
ncbi:MAG: radical SAM protein [Candidatus Omnitrophica bacterium]|nr:radical SAM protein [Candidatus Omnitrophota bacterium]